jgi:hypothetical protein
MNMRNAEGVAGRGSFSMLGRGNIKTMMTQPGSWIGAARLACAALLWLSASSGAYSQGATPFGRLAGQWSGKGTIELSNGTREPIRCRAVYDVLDAQKKLQLSIRCASESYSFELLSSVTYAAGAVTGTWIETTRNMGGTISGKASGDNFHVTAVSPAFTAGLTLTTHGDRQSVVIQPEDAKASVKRAAFSLQRN